MSLNVAARALITNQSVLQTIGHNIANANTVGYSRQTAELQQVPGQQMGNGYYGKGVEIAAVTRSYDAFLTRQANSTQTVASADAVRFEKMQQVESLFPLGEGSLGTMLNSALNAWVDVQSTPSDSTARGVVINRSDELAARIRDTSARLSEIGSTAKLQTAEVIKSINTMAGQIANLNDKISRAQSANAVPNDLLDQRDTLLADLSKKVNISTIGASDGTLTVFVASSYPLVLGNKAASLSVDRDPVDPENRQIVNFVSGTTKSTIPDDFLVGGELKGLQDFVNTDLVGAQAQIGRMGLALAAEVNTQQKSGLNLAGVAGTELFTYGNTVTSTGALGFQYGGQPGGSLVVSVSDATKLEADAYEVTMISATHASVTRLSDGVVKATNQPIATALSAVGLAMEQGATALAAGQKFMISPAADAAKSMAVALSAPADLAVSSSVKLTAGAANSTGLTVEAVAQYQSPAGALPITVAFNAAGKISLAGGAFQTFTPGQPLLISGYTLTLRGTPAATDTFSLNAMPAGGVAFNSGNAQAMLALRDKPVFDGSTTLSDGYVPVFSSVASTLSEVKFAAQFSATQAASAETQRANQAGVNLDEEAAKLIQYQQAYQASAKYMGTVQSLFDTLMSAFR